MESDSVAHGADHFRGVERTRGRGTIPEDDGAVGSDELGSTSGGNRRSEVDRFYLLWLDGDGDEAGFRAVGQSGDRSYGQILGDGVVAKLQFAGPAGFRGPVGDELLLVNRIGRRRRCGALTCLRRSGRRLRRAAACCRTKHENEEKGVRRERDIGPPPKIWRTIQRG